jgi:prepilin-type N-terminal cleavage/methylation domain-containing protein
MRPIPEQQGQFTIPIMRQIDKLASKLAPRAFSLLELMATLAVIALLVSLFFPALSKPKGSTSLSNCLSNYKQAGAALRMYTDDYLDWLPPGPVGMTNPTTAIALNLTQRPIYYNSKDSTKDLAYWLAPFVGLPVPKDAGANKTNACVMKTLLCPAYLESMLANSCQPEKPYDPNSDNDANAYSISVTRSTTGMNWRLKQLPFGDNRAHLNSTKLSAIGEQAHPAEVWAAGDFDTNCVPDGTLLGAPYWSGGAARKPAHGPVRCFVYFDLHVATYKAGGADTYAQ